MPAEVTGVHILVTALGQEYLHPAPLSWLLLFYYITSIVLFVRRNLLMLVSEHLSWHTEG